MAAFEIHDADLAKLKDQVVLLTGKWFTAGEPAWYASEDS